MAWCYQTVSHYLKFSVDQVIYCHMASLNHNALTHWGRVTHICVGNLTIIGPDNGLSPGRRQAIIRTNAGVLLIEPFQTNFSEISIAIHTFSFKEMHLKMLSGKWRPFCLGLIVLINTGLNLPQMNATGSGCWEVNIGSGNGLVPSGSKPLPGLMVTEISVAIWRH